MSVLLSAAAVLAVAPAAAQTVLDRVDPARVVEQAPRLPQVESATQTQAPSPATVAPAGTQPVTVGAVVLVGLEALRPADFADLIDTYVGRTLSPGALAGLADAVAARARGRGYVLASASIPPQAMAAGVLRIAVDEGQIDGIRLVGTANAAVEAALQPLVGAGPVTMATLERRLLIAGDVDGIWVRRSRLVREGTQNLLEVDVGADRFAATAGIDNSGSRPIGPVQADVTVRVAQLLAADDLVTFTALFTPTQPDEFTYGRLRYARRVSSDGTEVSVAVSAARSHPGAYLIDRDIDGSSWTASLGVLHPLLRRRAASLWLDTSLAMRTVRQERGGELRRRDRLSVARVGLNGFTDAAGGRLRANATLSRGLDLFDATRAGDPLASRDDADGTFTTLALAADWTRGLWGPISAQLAVAAQVAAEPLLVSEEIGLGGREFLRGYDYSERSGDQGAMASAELRWAVAPRLGPLRTPQLYGFVDGGRVTNLRDGFGTGTLVSAGGGLRSGVSGGLYADLGVAVPLSGSRYDSGDADPVANLRLTRRF